MFGHPVVEVEYTDVNGIDWLCERTGEFEKLNLEDRLIEVSWSAQTGLSACTHDAAITSCVAVIHQGRKPQTLSNSWIARQNDHYSLRI